MVVKVGRIYYGREIALVTRDNVVLLSKMDCVRHVATGGRVCGRVW